MYTKSEISKRYGVTLRTIERWMKDGYIPFHKFDNNRVMFNEKEIEEWEVKTGRKDLRLSTSK